MSRTSTIYSPPIRTEDDGVIAAKTVAGRMRALRGLVGENLARWLDVDPKELDAGAVFAEAFELKELEE